MMLDILNRSGIHPVKHPRDKSRHFVFRPAGARFQLGVELRVWRFRFDGRLAQHTYQPTQASISRLTEVAHLENAYKRDPFVWVEATVRDPEVGPNLRIVAEQRVDGGW